MGNLMLSHIFGTDRLRKSSQKSKKKNPTSSTPASHPQLWNRWDYTAQIQSLPVFPTLYREQWWVRDAPETEHCSSSQGWKITSLGLYSTLFRFFLPCSVRQKKLGHT